MGGLSGLSAALARPGTEDGPGAEEHGSSGSGKGRERDSPRSLQKEHCCADALNVAQETFSDFLPLSYMMIRSCYFKLVGLWWETNAASFWIHLLG